VSLRLSIRSASKPAGKVSASVGARKHAASAATSRGSRDIDNMTIAEMVGDMLDEEEVGTRPGPDDFDALVDEVREALAAAEVTITWPNELS